MELARQRVLPQFVLAECKYAATDIVAIAVLTTGALHRPLFWYPPPPPPHFLANAFQSVQMELAWLIELRAPFAPLDLFATTDHARLRALRY